MTQHLQDEIMVIDQKIKRVEKLIEEKQMKIERLQRKRGKLSEQLNNKTLGPEGLLERFSKSMAEAKEKSRLPSQEPATPKEDLKDLSQNIPSTSGMVKDEAYQASSKHYTIFNGPNAGCYKDWSTVQPLVLGKPVAYKGYPNYGLARQAFIDYCMKNNITLHTTPTLISPTDLLQPNKIPSYAEKAKLPPNPVQERTFARFNKISVKNPDSHDFISLETFTHYYRLAEVCNITEGCFISQTNGHRYFNAGEGADPSLRLTRLQICDLCELDSFTCDYEKHLFNIPNQEWIKYIEDYLRKIPHIGPMVIKDYKALPPINQLSLAVAKNLVKEKLEKICTDRMLAKKTKKINLCCSEFLGPETMYGCETIPKLRKWKKKLKKKYRFSKPRRRSILEKILLLLTVR
jgi:hypothetical protein